LCPVLLPAPFDLEVLLAVPVGGRIAAGVGFVVVVLLTHGYALV